MLLRTAAQTDDSSLLHGHQYIFDTLHHQHKCRGQVFQRVPLPRSRYFMSDLEVQTKKMFFPDCCKQEILPQISCHQSSPLPPVLPTLKMCGQWFSRGIHTVPTFTFGALRQMVQVELGQDPSRCWEHRRGEPWWAADHTSPSGVNVIDFDNPHASLVFLFAAKRRPVCVCLGSARVLCVVCGHARAV